MQIQLNTSDGVPIYLQIVQQIKCLVASGRLLPGEELPPIRLLAERLLINPNTVARAYRELERLGLVTKKSTTGTFISSSLDSRTQALTHLVDRVDELVREAIRHHVEVDDLAELVRQRHLAIHTTSGSPA